jgi:ABC-type amino acid transport substrate-binding protein
MKLAMVVAVLFAVLASHSPAWSSEAALRVCLDSDLPPLSVHRKNEPDFGFDVTLAEAVANKLGLALQIQWFESKLDEDSSPSLEANALLSDHRCSLVGAYALTRASLAAPDEKTAKLPEFLGATREDRRRRVAIAPLAATKPYINSPLTVVLNAKFKDRHVVSIDDLKGLRIVTESGTMADAILMTFKKGAFIDDIVHLVPGRGDDLLLSYVEHGDADATLLDLRRLDSYRATHPETKLIASGYYYAISANRGYVGLASESALVSSVDRALSDLQKTGTIAELARAAGLTYRPPREPLVVGDVWKKILHME